ncbi:MAG: N-acetylneuraminate [Rhodospirillaceae bacterium]|nr:MAG: N-acetylneuraminate [Rhodospirillaceae bacterium]TNC97420.1 MAG: N-acetylneuraminate synthase [Stygiobacter sp.]
MTGIRLKDRSIGPGHPVFVIAEAGVNHNGDLDMALRLVDVAADAGADAVKFQTFKAENIITRSAPKARYHVETTGGDEEQTWFQLLKTQELTADMHRALIQRCRQRGIMFLSTPYDVESVELLDSLDVDLLKVASTDANNIPFLEIMARTGRPMILSTAMCTLDEVKASVAAIRAAGCKDLLVMQCTGSYPAPADQANLRAMRTIAEACGVAVGYSDHIPGFSAALAATALGAQAYEKHFTLDRSLPGPDHRASLEPDELAALIAAIREVESCLGDGMKRVLPCEVENRTKLRKHLLAARDLVPGDVIDLTTAAIKRTGGAGISPDRFHQVAGRRLKVAVAADTPISDDMLD